MIRDKHIDISKITTDKNILKIFKIIEKHGGVVRFVGGAVRDVLAGRSGFDLDLSTDLSPDELNEACEDAGIRTVPIGLKFGTLGVLINNTLLEVSSLRKEEKQKSFTFDEFTDDWKTDASRRDLTINAVYADEQGNVFDYYNGIEDLEKGIVRFIGDPNQRIREDYLRILRFFRFYGLFGRTSVDEKALKACADNKEGLKTIAIERIRDELFKILQTSKAAVLFKMMFENEILSNWLADSQELDKLEFLINMEKDFNLSADCVRRLFVMYNPDKILAENISMRLKLTRKQRDTMVKLASVAENAEHIAQGCNISKLIYRYGREFCMDVLLIKAAQEKNYLKDMSIVMQQIQTCEVPVFPINGRDVLEFGGLSNAQIGNIMKILEQMWIDSGFCLSKNQLLEKAQELLLV